MDPRPLGIALGRRWMTWANGLTGLRALAVPALVIAILAGAAVPALVLFVLAIVTDFADGRVARRLGEVTAFGGLLDHAVDASFVVAGLGALATRGIVPWALPVLIAVAFLQYVLDSRVHEGRPLQASSLGRWNGIAYYVLLGVPLVRDGLALSWPGSSLVGLLAWTLFVSTGISILERGFTLLQFFRSRA